MTIKRWKTIFVLVLLVFLSGCGNSSDNVSPATSDSDSRKIHNEDQIKDDLLEQNLNIVWIDQQEQVLEISKLSIQRRKTEENYDEVYISIQLENDYYQVNAEYTLFYGYYDVGGWYLDDFEMTDYHSSAKKSIDTDEEFISFMTYQFDFCEITNRYQWTDEYGDFCEDISFTAGIDYEYWTVYFDGVYSYVFQDDMWVRNCYFDVTDIDWSRLLGVWTYRNDSLNMGAGFYSTEISVDINSVTQSDSENLQIAYSGNTYLYDKTSEVLCVDRSVSKERELTIHYSTEDVLGANVQIPSYISAIFVPWEYDSSIALYIDRDGGIYTEGELSSYGKTYLTKNVTTDDIQNAIDALKEMNE